MDSGGLDDNHQPLIHKTYEENNASKHPNRRRNTSER